MLQITRTALLLPDDDKLSAMRREFGQQQSLRLPAFIHTSLLDHISHSLETSRFLDTDHVDTAKRQFAKDYTIDGRDVATHILHLVLNNPKLFRTIEQITDCPAIGSFSGRIYRSV